MTDLSRETLTLLVTEVEGSHAHWLQAPEAMIAALWRRDATITVAVRQHGGTMIFGGGQNDYQCARSRVRPMPSPPPARFSAHSPLHPGRPRRRFASASG